MTSSVIINDLNIDWTKHPFRPFEANSPLLVDADAVLAFAITLERFQMVAGQVQIDHCRRRVKLINFIAALRSNPVKALSRLPSANSRVRLSR